MAWFNSILIVGAGGMLAHAIRSRLAERNLTFTAVDSGACDITDAAAVDAVVARTRPTTIINCAAFTNVDGCELQSDRADAVNGQGPRHLAAAAKSCGAKLVHLSTDYVFDGALRRPLRTDDPVGPRSAYGKSKLLGETEIQRVNPPGWMIIRTAWLYGPNGANFPQAMLNAAKAGKPLRVVRDQVGAPTLTFDLADALLNLLDHNAAGVWHIANSGETNWYDFAAAIFHAFGVRPEKFTAITSADWKQIKPDSADRPSYSVFDLSPYEKLIGKPVPAWQEALRRYRRMCE